MLHVFELSVLPDEPSNLVHLVFFLLLEVPTLLQLFLHSFQFLLQDLKLAILLHELELKLLVPIPQILITKLKLVCPLFLLYHLFQKHPLLLITYPFYSGVILGEKQLLDLVTLLAYFLGFFSSQLQALDSFSNDQLVWCGELFLFLLELDVG